MYLTIAAAKQSGNWRICSWVLPYGISYGISNNSLYGFNIHGLRNQGLYFILYLTYISALKSLITETRHIMSFIYYSERIVFKWSSFSFSHSQRIFILPFVTPFSWIRLLIKEPHTPAPAWCEFQSPSFLCDCVTDRLTLIVSPHPSVTLHQLSSDKPDRDKSLNKIWCPATTKREKWESVRCSLPCHSKEKETTERRSLLANEVKKDALLEPSLWQRSIEMSSIS